MELNQMWLSNLAPIFGICFLFLLNVRNRVFDDRSRRIFFLILALEASELVVANIESWLSALASYTVWRGLCSAVGYIGRPFILMLFVLMISPKKRTPLQNVLLFVPMALDVLAAFSVFFTDIVYSYNETNTFVRGPLGFFPIIIVIVYMIMLVCVVNQERISPFFDVGLTVFIVLYMAVSMLAETLFDVGNVGRTAMVYSTMFYFYVFQTAVLQHSLQAERDADRANVAKSNFLSRMSHDIRTPLNGIIGLLEIDKAHADDTVLVAENEEKMLVAADHLLSLINDVLEMSKLEDEEIELVNEPTDLNEISDTISTIMRTKVSQEGQTLKRGALDIPVRYVYTSPLHLRQIFLNIYSNCVKYNKPCGSITTSTECLENTPERVTYRWTISDTGIGMSPEYLERIFEPFTQEAGDSSARTGYQGTGLGMAIVKKLVDRMGGSIEVSSVMGEGTTFVVTIPFEVAPAPEKLDCASGEDVSIEGLNILLVEDNELNIEIAQVLMEDAGATVTTAVDGSIALELFRDSEPGHFDAILMDVMMPVMNGFEATRAIRALDREDATSVPIIATTANAFAEDAQKCFDAGMNAHLAKPLDITKLVETISTCVTERRDAE